MFKFFKLIKISIYLHINFFCILLVNFEVTYLAYVCCYYRIDE